MKQERMCRTLGEMGTGIRHKDRGRSGRIWGSVWGVGWWEVKWGWMQWGRIREEPRETLRCGIPKKAPGNVNAQEAWPRGRTVTNEWVSERVNVWMNEWVNEGGIELVNEWVSEWMSGWVMNEWMGDEWVDGRMNEWVNMRINEYTDPTPWLQPPSLRPAGPWALCLLLLSLFPSALGMNPGHPCLKVILLQTRTRSWWTGTAFWWCFHLHLQAKQLQQEWEMQMTLDSDAAQSPSFLLGRSSWEDTVTSVSLSSQRMEHQVPLPGAPLLLWDDAAKLKIKPQSCPCHDSGSPRGKA